MACEIHYIYEYILDIKWTNEILYGHSRAI